MSDRLSAPVILIDTPEDGVCESRGWVEATVSEDAARSLLADMCVDPESEDAPQPGDVGYVPFRPKGAATQVRLVPMYDPATVTDMLDPDEQRWCAPADLPEMPTDARTRCLAAGLKFWQIDVGA